MRPLSNDLRAFTRLLASEGGVYLFVGAWSRACHRRPRYTGNPDLFIRRDAANPDRFLRVLEAFGFGALGLAREDFLKEDFVIQLGGTEPRGPSHRYPRGYL